MPRGKADVNGGSRVFDPEAASGEPPTSCMMGPPRVRAGRPVCGTAVTGEAGDRASCGVASSRSCSIGSSGLPSTKTSPRRRKYGPMSTDFGVEPFPIARDAGQGEGIVGIGEHVAGEVVLPCGDLRRQAGRPRRRGTRKPTGMDSCCQPSLRTSEPLMKTFAPGAAS